MTLPDNEAPTNEIFGQNLELNDHTSGFELPEILKIDSANVENCQNMELNDSLNTSSYDLSEFLTLNSPNKENDCQNINEDTNPPTNTSDFVNTYESIDGSQQGCKYNIEAKIYRIYLN